MATKVYDPEQILIDLGGIIPQGYADGEFVRIEMEGDGFTDVCGTDGEVSRSKNMDRRATITFSLMQTSSTNLLFSAVANLDRAIGGGAGIMALTIRDAQGQTLYRAAEAWISREPDAAYGKEAATRAWSIRVAKLIRLDAGN